MYFNKTTVYLNLMTNLTYVNTTGLNTSLLFDYVDSIYHSELDDKYGVPMKTIGLYIAVASLGCIIAMFADLVHGLRSRKLWFPSKYFRINAVSLTVIAIAMKLPVDLSGSMPGVVDQTAKLGSMAFMCTMMANFLPSLATKDSKALLENIAALVVLVITMVLNICIQIHTGVIVKYGKEVDKPLEPLYPRQHNPMELQKVAGDILGLLNDTKKEELRVLGSISYVTIARIYVVLLLLLLVILVSSSLVILKSKQIIQRKYQQGHQTASEGVQPLTVEKLQKRVSNYWIMAGSGSPQFILVFSATTTASGVICFLTLIFHVFVMIYAIPYMRNRNYGSDYKWSTEVILIVQFIGGIVGTVAPLSRCFAHIKVAFKVEKYWTEKLYDWKYGHTSLPFGIRSHKLKLVIKNLKILILNICIILQTVVVVICKLITLVLVESITEIAGASRRTRTKNSEQRKYVLQLENDEELAEKTLEGLSKSLGRLIQKSEKKQPKDLMKLITEKCTEGFQGVRKYDNNDNQDCWSLPVVTLTTIAVTLPNIEKMKVKSLLKSVRRGLEYVTLVEENLINATDDYISIQRAAAMLWEDVDFRHNWLGIRLKDITSQVNKAASSEKDATMQIVQLFLKEAQEKKIGVGRTDDESKLISISVNSMSRTQKIIDGKESHKELFEELSSRIADILAACLTNLPQVIAMKCHTDVIEKREACVEAATKLLGETKEIINKLQANCKVPSMNVDDLPFIDKWRACLSEP